jgi:hypothetical protein
MGVAMLKPIWANGKTKGFSAPADKWLINKLTSTKPSITTPNAAANTWPCSARCQSGSLRNKKSITTRNNKLTTQLPSALPTARFGASAMVTLVMPVTSSGNEVTVASKAKPTQLPDKPVRCAMMSP